MADRISDDRPGKIAGRMHFENASLRMCLETIYRHVFSREGFHQELWWDLPTHRKFLTFDRDPEFVARSHLQAEIGIQTWFCDLSAPQQKGTVKSTNRRSRRWLPGKRDMTLITDPDLKMIFDRLNATPRKCPGWKTPAKVFREKMLAS